MDTSYSMLSTKAIKYLAILLRGDVTDSMEESIFLLPPLLPPHPLYHLEMQSLGCVCTEGILLYHSYLLLNNKETCSVFLKSHLFNSWVSVPKNCIGTPVSVHKSVIKSEEMTNLLTPLNRFPQPILSFFQSNVLWCKDSYI